jgi:hypothetical protein
MWLAFVLLASGVGNKPESFAAVGRSNVGSSQHCPFAVIPERGQVTEDNSESPSKQSWAVLHECEAGSNLANDARHVSPHAGSFAADSGSFSGQANVLARETA